MEKTIFAKIIDRELPAKLAYEDDRCIAIHDIQPAAPTHLLIIPKKPIDRIASMTSEDEALVGHLCFVAGELARRAGLADFRLVVNNGAGAGQSVFHLHVHLLAGRPLEWPPG